MSTTKQEEKASRRCSQCLNEAIRGEAVCFLCRTRLDAERRAIKERKAESSPYPQWQGAPYGSAATGYSILDHFGNVIARGIATLDTAEGIVRSYNAYPKLVEAIQADAAERAFKAGLGVSEWKAFLSKDTRKLLSELGELQ